MKKPRRSLPFSKRSTTLARTSRPKVIHACVSALAAYDALPCRFPTPAGLALFAVQEPAMLTAQLFARLPTFKKTPGRPAFSAPKEVPLGDCPPRGHLVRSARGRGG